jgi:hypothetical protein
MRQGDCIFPKRGLDECYPFWETLTRVDNESIRACAYNICIRALKCKLKADMSTSNHCFPNILVSGSYLSRVLSQHSENSRTDTLYI